MTRTFTTSAFDICPGQRLMIWLHLLSTNARLSSQLQSENPNQALHQFRLLHDCISKHTFNFVYTKSGTYSSRIFSDEIDRDGCENGQKRPQKAHFPIVFHTDARIGDYSANNRE